MKVAILDLGTNTFHLLIANVNDDGLWEKVLKERATVKLGQKGIHKNIIAPGPYQRGIKAIEGFYHEIKRRKIKNVVAFGTAALRNAENSETFINEIKKKFGITIQLISGKEEATLIYLGVKQALNNWKGTNLIMDIGGGSVEFIIADEKKILWKQSYKLGAALLLETFKPTDPIKPSEIREIEKYVDLELVEMYEACKKFKPKILVGSAGSFETFSSMIWHRFPSSGSHYGKTEHLINIDHFKAIFLDLIVSDKAKRNRMKGLIKMRIDMIVPASILLNLVLKKTKIKSIKLSSYSLKEGALVKVFSKK